jgi:hypothetical protein
MVTVKRHFEFDYEKIKLQNLAKEIVKATSTVLF